MTTGSSRRALPALQAVGASKKAAEAVVPATRSPNGAIEAVLAVEKIAFTIPEAVFVSGLSRSTLYDEIAAGRLKSRRVAGRRLILRSELEAFLVGNGEAA